MLAFSNDYYGLIFRVTQSVELFCAYIVSSSAPDARINTNALGAICIAITISSVKITLIVTIELTTALSFFFSLQFSNGWN